VRTLVATESADGQAPDDWLWETGGHSIEAGRLKVSGNTTFRIPLPGQGLADSVTMKEVWPRSYFAEQILRHSRQRAVSVIFCPFNNYPPGAHTPVRVAGQIGAAKAGGFDGFQFYKSATIVAAGPDGILRMTRPALRDVFRSALEA